MRLSARECVARGWANFLGNWRLIPLMMIQSLVLFGLTVLGLLAPVAALGLVRLPPVEAFGNPAALEAVADRMVQELIENGGRFAAGVGVLLILWTVAFFVYCYFQAGLYGVLVAGDRQSPPGEIGDRRFFATFNLRDFHGWGSHYFWRFFWFVNFFLLVTTAGLLPLTLAAWLVAQLSVTGAGEVGSGGLGLALAVGCGGVLITALFMAGLMLWYVLALPDLVRPESGVRAAARRGWVVLRRRPGAAVLLVLIYLAICFAIAGAFFPLSTATQVSFGGDLAAVAISSVALSGLQGLVYTIPTIFFAACVVALVRSESRLLTEDQAALVGQVGGL